MVEQQHLVNIAKAIEKGTRVTTLDELKAKGQNQVKVINAAKIMELIREAVDIAIESMTGQKLGAERDKLQAAAKREFDELLRKYQDTQKSKGEIEGQASKMQAEIDAVQALLKGGAGGAEAAMGLAGLSGQIQGLVQKLQASEKARIEQAVHQKRIEGELEELKKQAKEIDQQRQAVGQTLDQIGMKARELGLVSGPEPTTPEQKMQRLAQIAEAAVARLEREQAEKQQVRQQLAETEGRKSAMERQMQAAAMEQAQRGTEAAAQIQQTEQKLAQVQKQLAQEQAKRQVAEKELGELQDFKRKLEEKVDEQGSQLAEGRAIMASIGKRADDLIHEVEHGRLKHLKPEEKKIIIDAMTGLKEDLARLQEERAFLEKKLFYMSMTIDSLEAELLAAKGLTPAVGGSAHLKDDGLGIVFDEAGVAAV